jgi:hypothetical protein
VKGRRGRFGLAVPRASSRLAVAALLGGALIWGLIWYPYRLLRDGGVDGVVASTATYALLSFLAC